jgi:hypothetical protein
MQIGRGFSEKLALPVRGQVKSVDNGGQIPKGFTELAWILKKYSQ